MPYLWSREALWSLLKHRSEDVQEWAVSRLLDLYPEAEADLLRVLPYTTPAVATRILPHIQGHSCPPSLVEFFQRTKQPHLKARAAVLLLRSGYALSMDQLAAVNLDGFLDSLADTEPGFNFLLQRYRDAPAHGSPLLHALALACGCAEIFGLLEQESRQQDWQEIIDALGNAWGCDLSALRGGRGASEALGVLEQTLHSTHVEGSVDTPWKQELLSALAQDRRRLQAVVKAAGGRISRLRKPALAELAMLLACALALQRDVLCQTLLRGAQEVAELWQALVLRPWRANVGPGLADFLQSLDPASVLASLKIALGRGYAYADYPFRVLNTLALPGRFELFLEASQGAYNEQFAEEAEKALQSGGPPAAEVIVAHYRSHLPEPSDLFILADIPTPEVEEFLWEHFEHYMCHAWSDTFVEVLELVASRRFLEPLLTEWRAGELALGRAITLIAAIHGVQEQRLRSIARDVEERSRTFKRFMENAGAEPEGAFRKMLEGDTPFTLPLRCTTCGRTYHYVLQKVYLDPKQAGEVVVGQIIQCKGCNSIETYELTPAIHLALTAEMLRLRVLTERDKSRRKGKKRGELPKTPLILQKPQIMAAGRHFRTLGEAYWFLKGEVDQHPTSGELHRRLGNVLKNGNQPDLALSYLLKATALEPGDAEACYNVVEVLLAQERYREAIPHLERLVQLCREEEMDEALRRDLFGALLEQVVTVEQKTKHRIELFPTANPRAGSQPGMDQEQSPPVVYLTSFDLSNARDFERVYHMFRTGQLPEPPRKGPLRFLRGTLPTGEAAPEAGSVSGPRVRELPRKVGRNAPCPCGSGRKYKRCCGMGSPL